MKKRGLLLTAALAVGLGGVALVLHAQAPNKAKPPMAEAGPRNVSSRIVQVTVYPDSALVTREIEVPAGKGTLELVVSPLPEHTIPNSLYSEGSNGFQILSTRFRNRAVKEDTREEVRKAEDDLKKLRHEAQRIQSEIQVLQQNMAMLTKLENFTSANTKDATEKGKLDSESTITLAKYLMEGRNEKGRQMVALQQQQELNHEQTEFLQRKLREMTSGVSRTERDAVLIIDKEEEKAGKVRLNYLVDKVTWRPQYKFRAGQEPTEPVQLEYLAAVMQQTGEDWQGVDLILSTAQPMLNASPPELMMLAVNVVPRETANQIAANPPPMPQPNQNFEVPGARGPVNQTFGQPRGTTGLTQETGPGFGTVANPVLARNSAVELSNQAQILRKKAQEDVNKFQRDSREVLNLAGTLEQARDLVLSMEETQKPGANRGKNPNEGPSVVYRLGSKLTIPSRNDEHVLEVARLDMMPDYFYKAVPVLTPHVYRQANLNNKSKYVLLPGEATMYNGSDFVGRMNLPLVAIGELFTVGFGTEPQLQVQRQMVDKARSQQGGNQILKYEYRILVNSYKSEKVKLQLWDRLPTAENETMGITLAKTEPELCKDAIYQREDKPNNLLRWDLEIEPTMNGEKARVVKYEFKLEMDRQMTIGTFQSR